MTLRHIIAGITMSLVIGLAVSPAYAGTDDNKTEKKGKRSASLKQGEKGQGTIGYRFDTYGNYECGECSTTDYNAGLNDAYRVESEPYSHYGFDQPAVIVDKSKGANKATTDTNKKATDSPTND